MKPLPPTPQGKTGLRSLSALIRERSLLAALQVLHADLGDVFRIPLPGFDPVMLAGPQASRFVLVEGRDEVRWRSEGDPVTHLLRRGVLVVDGELHDAVRAPMNPSLHRRMFGHYIDAMIRVTDRESERWSEAEPVDMLVEMRRIALLILIETLFGVDFEPHLERLWRPVMRTLSYISPGLWLIWRGSPRPGYRRPLQELDDYLYEIITERRAGGSGGNDLLADLLREPEMTDDLIRDQLLTMLIAGHDTSTALFAWTLYLLGIHNWALERAAEEVQVKIGKDTPNIDNTHDLSFLMNVIDESLRLYPPIHIGNRVAARDLEFGGYRIPAETRVTYSIYLTHRHPDYWEMPDRFVPDRFSGGSRPQPYTFLPFGGGPRNCIGGAYAQVEARVVLARLLQRFDLEIVQTKVRPSMGATLEPHPGVWMKVRRRDKSAPSGGS